MSYKEAKRRKRCQFCNQKGYLADQDMGQGRVMWLCDSCRQVIREGERRYREAAHAE